MMDGQTQTDGMKFGFKYGTDEVFCEYNLS